MKNSEKQPDDSDAVVESARAILEDAQPIQTEDNGDANRQRHFALGLFLVAIFLVSLAAILPASDRWFWGGASFVILLTAAWSWDRAR